MSSPSPGVGTLARDSNGRRRPFDLLVPLTGGIAVAGYAGTVAVGIVEAGAGATWWNHFLYILLSLQGLVFALGGTALVFLGQRTRVGDRVGQVIGAEDVAKVAHLEGVCPCGGKLYRVGDLRGFSYRRCTKQADHIFDVERCPEDWTPMYRRFESRRGRVWICTGPVEQHRFNDAGEILPAA